MSITVDLVAEMSVLNPFDFFLTPSAENYPFNYEPLEKRELTPYLIKPPATRLVGEYLARISRERRRTIDFIVEVNRRVANDIGYLIRMEPGVQLPEETLVKASGSCRDAAALVVHLFRHLGLAARFVSGYLIQLTPDVKSLDGPAGPTRDFTDLHAWCEVYLPGAGWVGLDPTSGLLAGEGHIPLACSPEPATAAPVSGAVDKSEVDFTHEMSIQRIWEAPRVTLPYTSKQWAQINALGETIDKQLVADDVRLTMGGEPTFVSMDEPDHAEWNTAALGPTKRLRAAQLFHKLKDKYAPHGLAHYGQGKWYPGEELPRWSLNCFWRRDGQPVWSDSALVADEARSYAAGPVVAKRFLEAVARKLDVDSEFVFPGYEDVYYYLWRERKLPVNVDPFNSKLDNAQERMRLTKLYTEGLDKVTGYGLPIARDDSGKFWESGSWFLRADRCYLIPGDSPMGYRLPLDSQPWVAKSDYPYMHQPDPSQDFPPLPEQGEIHKQLRDVLGTRAVPRSPPSIAPAWPLGGGTVAAKGATAGSPVAAKKSAAPVVPLLHQSAKGVVRTAMIAEPRDGRLYVFMPPAETLEDYLLLIAAVEAAAAVVKMPVIVEGYEPPRDPRLDNFRVTPDPGVIEVNIQPAANWSDMVVRTEHLYESARETRLITEKFMLDGRHTGTGGGNHCVLGGATMPDSPFLRRPDLLRSLLAYWHNHPSLSYLFAGLFIGPTSQAPRIDEARNDSLYELEIAFRELTTCTQDGTPPAPWLVDRLFRNLLIDVSGNTHRSEFCIDKLYSPDGPTGRLGLLELRAFEMPPHARMSLTQQLLLRSLVARFWREPYSPPKLARWGTELHDRFLLPYFVQQDFADVLAEQRAAGHALKDEWFAPHFEFRFPKYGEFATRGTEIEIRHALEPWHVMGEEGAAGTTVRYVDSSVERVQVKVTGLAPDRYAITCNGHVLPLRPTGVVGEYVAGVRYRAWHPSAALHPTIGVHSPLTFDLVDTWMKRSLGGCQYHVTHPGGRSYDTFPVNSFEAESRRLARFFRINHSHGSIAIPAAAAMGLAAASTSTEFPFTLDLRRSVWENEPHG
ncbi:MAG: transglutaminase family protein, partial [Steroidobacteraceae bacterium]